MITVTNSWAQVACHTLYVPVGVRGESREGCTEEEVLLLVVSDVWAGGPKNRTETRGSAWLLVDPALMALAFSSLHPPSC